MRNARLDGGLLTSVKAHHSVQTRIARSTDMTFEMEDAARAALAERFSILVQMEKYAGGKHTRVIRILEDDDDWPTRPGGR